MARVRGNSRLLYPSKRVLVIYLSVVAILIFIVVHVCHFTSLQDTQKLQSSESDASAHLSREKLQSRLDWLLKSINRSSETLKQIKEQQEGLDVNLGADIPAKKQESAEPLVATRIGDGDTKSQKGDLRSGNQSAGHRILALDDDSFQAISIDEMMSWYGEADGGGTCSEDFGNALINKWRGVKQQYCAASKPSGPAPSSIDCYLVRQTRHHGDGDNLCVMRNVAVNMGLFGDDSVTRPVVQEYVNTRHNIQPYIKFPMGFIKAACDFSTALWQPRFMPGWNADLTTGAVRSVADINAGDGVTETAADAVVCDEWVDHPVLIVQRDTFANFFHDSEDFFNVFIAMAVLQWTAGNTQIYLTDLYPKGPFWNMWSDVFSPKSKEGGASKLSTLTAWDLRNTFGQKISTHTSNKEYNVCYKQLAIGIYGPAAPMTVASWDTPCSKTALVRAYSDYVIRGLGLQGKTHYADEAPSRTIVITYMARRASSEWPEKKYCSDTESFFLCKLWADFGPRNLGRMVSNESEVMKALKALEERKYKTGAKVRFQDVDYNVLTFKEQIEIDLETDIMIGPHGAGLMHNIFMRDRAALIELFVDGSSVNRHFHNLAHWFGRAYEGVPIGNPINVDQMTTAILRAINNIDLSKF